MTNEEIYKYARKTIGNKHDKHIFNSFMLGIIGILLMLTPDMINHTICYPTGALVTMLLATVIFMLLWFRLAVVYQKQFRDCVYNLVRQDERNRCMTKMERYENEGSR